MVQDDTSLMYQYWGKSAKGSGGQDNYHLLVYHCLDVAAAGNALLRNDDNLRSRLTSAISWSEKSVLSFTLFWLALHDLGKCSESFQNLQPNLFCLLKGRNSDMGYLARHDEIGFRFCDQDIRDWFFDEILSGFILKEEDPIDWEEVTNPWISSVFGHHGKPPAGTACDIIASHILSDEDLLAVKIIAKAFANLFLSNQFLINTGFQENWIKESKNISWIISGLVTISDWIASTPAYFPFVSEVIALDQYWSEYACPQAKKAISISGVQTWPVSQETGISALFPLFSQKNITPSPLQHYVSECHIGSGPHLFIIEESTGGGKTEAAVTLAHRMMEAGNGDGMYVALPTMATANAMYERMAGCYERLYKKGSHPSLILSHGAKYLSSQFVDSIEMGDATSNIRKHDEDAMAFCSWWLADHAKSSLLASVGVGTIDQALVAILPVKYHSLRLFGLMKNVLVVDEVHAYDPYMNQLLRTLLFFQAALSGSAILLSATIPQVMRQELVRSFNEGMISAGSSLTIQEENSSQVPNFPLSYPLVTHVCPAGYGENAIPCRSGTRRSVKITLLHDEEVVKEELLKCIYNDGCACWVRNTVGDAVRAFEWFASRIPAENIRLFHARFAMGDRLTIERAVIHDFGKNSAPEDRAGKILIATQVVEQSLDIDFDFLVSDLAPIDLIIQRAGRLHRHQRAGRGEPVMGILSPLFSEDPQGTWYEDMFPGGSYVYPIHRQLWLTARILLLKKEIFTPDDARELIEAVYGAQAIDLVPDSILKRDIKADVAFKAATGRAMMYSLSFSQGYQYGNTPYTEEDKTPTRLAEPSVVIRLGRWDRVNGDIKPLCNDISHAWEMSSVTVMRSRVPDPIEYPQVMKNAVIRTEALLPDRGKWSVLIPLEEGFDGNLSLIIQNKNQREIQFQYHAQKGFMISMLNQ